jgi:hypothetical protein
MMKWKIDGDERQLACMTLILPPCIELIFDLSFVLLCNFGTSLMTLTKLYHFQNFYSCRTLLMNLVSLKPTD